MEGQRTARMKSSVPCSRRRAVIGLLCRAIRQMNLARPNPGVTFILLISICRLPGNAVDVVRRKILDGCAGGGFKKRYHQRLVLKIYNDFLNAIWQDACPSGITPFCARRF